MNERIPLAKQLELKTGSTSTLSDNFDSISTIKGHIYIKLENTSTNQVHMESFPNVIVKDAGILIARLLASTAVAHQSEPGFGIWGLAVGTGDIGWDPKAPPAATNSQRSLWNELGRKKISSIDFIDSDGDISGVPTNVIDFTTVFSESEVVGPLMEMALIGGDNDTDASVRNPVLPPNGAYDPTVNMVGKDCLINYKTFRMKYKEPTDRLTITWRITI